jgi:uncharacterized membrane protein YsdA (DUF1294 family)
VWMGSRDVYGGLVRRLLDPAPKWMAALFILAYFLILGLRILRLLYTEWWFARIHYLLYSSPSLLTLAMAAAFVATLFLLTVHAFDILKSIAILAIVAGLSTAVGTGIARGGYGSRVPAPEFPKVEIPLLALILTFLLPVVNIFALLFDNAARVVSATMPAIPLMVLASSVLGFLAMKIDKIQAAMGGWRLSERSIFWYALTGGGPGVIAAALRYRHKTLHKGLLTKVLIATTIAYMALARGLSTLWVGSQR